MGETTVVEVERKEKRGGKAVAVSVTLATLGIYFRGYRKRGGGIGFTRFKLGAQVCDRSELWVPDKVYAEIYRRAVAILCPSDLVDPERPVTNPDNSKSGRQKKRSKTFRRPVSNHTLPLPF